MSEFTELRRLPVRRDEWHVGVIAHDEATLRAYCLCVGRELEWVGEPMPVDGPGEVIEAIVRSLARVATDPDVAHVPRLVRTNSAGAVKRLRELLPPRVKVERSTDLHLIVGYVEELRAGMDEVMASVNPVPPIYPGKNGQTELRDFAEAGATLWQAAPWTHAEPDRLFVVRRPRAMIGMRYFSVMGDGGMEYGLSFFHRQSDFEAMLVDPEAALRDGCGPSWGVTFDPIEEMNGADAHYWEDLKIPLSDGGRRFPSPLRMDGAGKPRPTVTRLRFLATLMEGLAAGVTGMAEGGVTTANVEVEIA